MIVPLVADLSIDGEVLLLVLVVLGIVAALLAISYYWRRR